MLLANILTFLTTSLLADLALADYHLGSSKFSQLMPRGQWLVDATAAIPPGGDIPPGEGCYPVSQARGNALDKPHSQFADSRPLLVWI